MGFVNRYEKADNFNYYYSEEFLEDGIPFVYSVGQTIVPTILPNGSSSTTPDNKVGLISKVKLNGDIVWEKTYIIINGSNPEIKSIIQLRADDGNLEITPKYVLIVKDQNKYFLFSIDQNGEVLWTKHLDLGSNIDLNIFIKESITDSTFYLAASSSYFANTYSEYLAKYKSNGGLLINKGSQIISEPTTLQFGGLYLTGIDSYNGGIIVISNLKKEEVEKSIITKFDSELAVTQTVAFGNYINASENIEINDVKIKNNKVIISGNSREKETTELFILDFNTLEFIQGIYIEDCLRIKDTKLALIGTNIYCLWNDVNKNIGIINCFSDDFQFNWSKNIFINDENFIKRISAKGNRLTFTCNDNDNLSTVVNCNSILKTCKTAILNAITFYDKTIIISQYPSSIDGNPLNIDVAGPTITATLYSPQAEVKRICPLDNSLSINQTTLFQSPNFIVTAAGSKSYDGSASGVHLRWAFAESIGENHLPKGDYYSGENFLLNKPDDYVRVYRTPYIPVQSELNFSQIPSIVNNAQNFWIYTVDDKPIYVKFKNSLKYNEVLSFIQPLIDPLSFIANYGSEMLEIECKLDMFFATTIILDDVTTSSEIKVETLSVEKNLQTAPKITSSRKRYDNVSINNGVKILSENGRCVRFKASNCSVVKINFEFYSSFIENRIDKNAWLFLNQYALSIDTTEVINRLEPIQDIVNNKWPRYNDGEKVNINNYIDKWEGITSVPDDKNIRQIVDEYLQISSNINLENPRGLITINYGADSNFQIPQPNPDEEGLISLLDMLNIGAHDYHIARMLGLGTLDISSEAASGERYVYVSEYKTYGDLNDGLGAREVQHLSMSLPTSIYDFRLPISYDLKEIVPGIILNSNEENNGTTTDPEGYTQDGKYRYVTLVTDNLPEEEVDRLFYWSQKEFNLSEFTYPLYAGVEYRKNTETDWVRPELVSNPNYQNTSSFNETIPLLINLDTNVLTVHKQRESGTHYYSSYGINIFSRATSSIIIKDITTIISPTNNLKPPVGINPFLIRKEEPLLLTSESEQNRKNLITSGQDDTLIRLIFEYNAIQELTRYLVEDIYLNENDSTLEQVLIGGQPTHIYPDDKEVFADEVEIYFRNQLPNSVSGKVITIQNHPTNELLLVMTTSSYIIASSTVNSSTPVTITPSIAPDKVLNYIGGNFVLEDQSYIIHEISVVGTYPVFTVFKAEISNSIITNGLGNSSTENVPIIQNDGLFSVVENLQNTVTWNNPTSLNALSNPHTFKVLIGLQNSNDWKIKREVIHNYNDGQLQRFIEKSRGIWKEGIIEKIDEPIQQLIDSDGTISYTYAHNGLYKITFNSYSLPQHSQYDNDGISVEWLKGIVRLRTVLSLPLGERKSFEVIKNINNSSNHLEIYFKDVNFDIINTSYDQVAIGNQLINFYPSYRVYLYKKDNLNMNRAGILPALHQGERFSIFGLRSHNINKNYFSKFSVPALMFAQELAEPQQPQLPLGSKYATRPDYFGKSTYSFVTKFGVEENSNYRPHGLLYLRSNEDIILDSLYTKETHKIILIELAKLGGNDEEFLQNRWNNFFDFITLKNTGIYQEFPASGSNKYAFPIPNSIQFIKAINDFIHWHNQTTNESIADIITITSLNQSIISTVTPPIFAIDFIEETIKNTFQPLTEMPLIFQYIKSSTYEPIPKKQTIKDRDGFLLKVTHQDFDIAPMAKRVSNTTNHVLFTDFTLDGTSKNVYFYSVREMSNQMQLGELSKFLGPIKLVNSNPPSTPEIKRIMPVLQNKILGVMPSIQFEINSYDKVHLIKKINLYRTFDRQNAESVRFMDLVKVIDIDTEGFQVDEVWKFYDDFSDLQQVIPYSDPIFYRVTVSRKVEYPDGTSVIIDYVPSTPTKITATTIVENYSPDSPVLSYASQPINSNGKLNFVTLFFNKKVYKGNYHLFIMNKQGNWIQIAKIISDRFTDNMYHIYNINSLGIWIERTTINSLNNIIYLPLEITNINATFLQTKNADGNSIYHHFKVITENTSGMFSSKENILSIYNSNSWTNIGGIAVLDHSTGMIIGPTFIISPDGVGQVTVSGTLEIE